MNASQIADLIEQSRTTGRPATRDGVRVSAADNSIHIHLPGEIIYGGASPDSAAPSPELLAAIDAALPGFTFSHALADSDRGAYAETWVYVAR